MFTKVSYDVSKTLLCEKNFCEILHRSQPAIICSKLTIVTLEECVRYVQN